MPTIGSRGDVQPYISLAVELQDRGHQVQVATHPCMRSLVEFYNIPFAPIGPDIDIGFEAAAIRDRASNFMTGMIRVMKFSFAMLEQSHADLLELAKKTDVVIVSHTAAGSIEADELNKPKISITLHPQAIPDSNPEEPAIRKLVGSLAGWSMGFFMRRPLDKIRRKVGVEPMGQEGITSKLLNLIPISPHVFEPNPFWEARHKITGYWFSEPPFDWIPPVDLAAFLKKGEAPVVISLGAMALDGRDMKEAASLTVDALQQLGLRAVIQGWDGVMKGQSLPEQIIHIGSVPHTYLLKYASCLVHHGGFGTTAAAFRAGIPAVIIPHIIDQYIWGQKVFELGVGPKPVPRNKLTMEALSAALDQAVNNSDIHKKANDLGKLVRSERGLQNALRMIEEALQQV